MIKSAKLYNVEMCSVYYKTCQILLFLCSIKYKGILY
jgi:hypothetical protein